MSWDQDRDHNLDDATHGFSRMSAAFIPRSTARGIWLFFLTVLLTAGLLGASFEAVQSVRVVSKVINGSTTRPVAIHDARRKDR